MRVVSTAANDFIRILFEPACAGCRQVLASPLTRAVCDDCWRSITPVSPPFCTRCGDQLAGPEVLEEEALEPEDYACQRCRQHPPGFALARSAGRYEGPLREVMHTFKYEGRRQLGAQLGLLLREAGREVLAGADAVVPVPLHWVRSLRRGFNQADDLARNLRRPVWRVLRRRRLGPSQASLTGAARRRNLRPEFAVRRVGRVRGATLVVIDDVMTTGATLDACARALVEAGAAEVRALTVARAVAGRPPRPLETPRPLTPLR